MWNPFAREKKDDNAKAVPDLFPEAPGGWGEATAAGRSIPLHDEPPPAAPSEFAQANAPAPEPEGIAEIEHVSGAAVATLNVTELSQDVGASQLSTLLGDLEESGASNFVLDLNTVQFMDSTCLGCLVGALNRLAARGGQIAIANGNQSVQYLFKLTRLDRVFTVCPDVMTALSVFERREAC